MKERYLSSTEVAKLLGVSVATVKRWADDKILPAHTTPGKHRRFLRSELEQVIRENRYPCLRAIVKEQHPEDLAEKLRTALLEEDSASVRSILQSAFDQKLSVATMADRIISPAMRDIGHQWERKDIDVYEEHRATQLCAHGLHYVRAQLDVGSREKRPLAIGGCPEGDHYKLPTLLAEMVLLEQGWRTTNLGPNTPMTSFGLAVERHRPALVWVSVSYLPEPERFLSEYEDFYHLCRSNEAQVIVGGNALDKDYAQKMTMNSFGLGLGHLATFADPLLQKHLESQG